MDMKSLDRLKEPSTMAGLMGLAGAANEMFQVVEPETVEAVAGAVGTLIVNPTPAGMAMAAFGLLAMFMKEGRH